MGESRILEQYDELVALAYTGIREDKPWQSFVEHLAAVADIEQAALLITSPAPAGQPTIVTSEQTPDLITREYFQRVLATDTMRFINSLTVAQPLTLAEVLPASQWLGSELYKEFLKPRQIDHSLIIDVWRDPIILVRLGVERTDSQGAFSGAERELLGRLAKHLSKSISLLDQLHAIDASSAFYQEVMNRLGIGVLFLNRHNELVQANQTGESILQRSFGIQLLNGRVAAANRASRPAFDAMLNALSEYEGGAPLGIRLPEKQGQALVEVVGRRLPSSVAPDTYGCTTVLLLLPAKPTFNSGSVALLQTMYAFTDRENSLALALAQGYSTLQIADLLGVSVNTIKTHLKGVFEKTGCNKQAQVVALLNNSALRLL